MEEKNKGGRPQGSKNLIADSVKIRDSISKVITKYFTSGLFEEDMALGKSGDKRMRLHIELLPYTLTKKESIKTTLQGLSSEEQADLASRINSELKK